MFSSRQRRSTTLLKVMHTEAFVNVIIELLEVHIQQLFLSEELANQFPESFLILVSYQMYQPGAIVDKIQLVGKVFFLTTITTNVLQKKLLHSHTGFKVSGG